MKFRALALLPAAWVGVFVTVASAVPAAAVPAFIRTEIEAAKALTLAGCVVAARAFSPGDYMRRAWLTLGGSWATLLLRDAIFLGFPPGAIALGQPLVNVMAALSLVANLFGVVGCFMIAKAWHVAGLELPGRPAQRTAVMALLIALALAIAGPAVLDDVRLLLGGDVSALVGFASSANDLLSICFVAPVLFTALALRGGLLRWPWAFLTTSLLLWLFYDAAPVLARLLGLTDLPARVFREAFRGGACLYGFSAGLAQAMALREPVSPR
jgi:hypothetical protein